MLKKILSITGRPGLFEIVSQGKNAIIVEDLGTKRRFPALSRDKIVALGDIAIYTEHEEKPLAEVFEEVYKYSGGKPVEIAPLVKEKKLKEVFGEILPEFDRDRVHDSDIKKLFSWYNILLGAGFTKFVEEEKEETEETPKED